MKDAPVEDLWEHYFNMKAVKRTGWKMDTGIVTDGVGCTVRLKRPLKENEKQGIKANDDHIFRWRQVDALDSKKVIAVDPGRRDLFSACTVRLNGANSVESRHLDYNNTHCSNKEYRNMAGFHASERRHARMLVKNPDIAAFYKDLPSMKTTDLSQCQKHLEYFAANHTKATAMVLSKDHRNQHFNLRRAAQRTMDLICNRILGTSDWDKYKDIVVAFGSGSFSHASKGHGPGPTKTIKRALARRCQVIHADEYNSSQLCSSCGSKLTDTPLPRHARAFTKPKLSWGLRRCENNECESLYWNRDVNAARNIGWRFLCEQKGLEIPKGLKRTREDLLYEDPPRGLKKTISALT